MRIIDLGLTHFKDAYECQANIHRDVAEGCSENTLVITEHRPVITVGRKGTRENILRSGAFLSSRGIEVFDIDRGGDVTYHGPGQLVAYPIFKLENEARDIHVFLNLLEDIGKNFLLKYGVVVDCLPAFRGIWVGGRKIGSIGIGVKRWVTHHGIAVNINMDLIPFSFIRPCGMEWVRMTSLKEVTGQELDINDAKDRLVSSFREVPLLAETVDKA